MSEWPDGTVAACYRFLHALYQQAWYERVPAARRQRWHRRIGAREEAAYGPRAGERAAELAVHFAWGRDYQRAVHYLRQAAETAVRRSAYREAIDSLRRGLELLTKWPDTPERPWEELELLTALGPLLRAIQGDGAPEVEKVYTRARELCCQIGETPRLFPVLVGLLRFYVLRAELQTARELGEQCLTLAQRPHDPALLLDAHRGLVAILFWLGELAPARAHLEQCRALYDPPRPRPPTLHAVQDPQVSSVSIEAMLLWLLGYPDQALYQSAAALRRAHQLKHPFSLAYALNWAAMFHHARRETWCTQERAEAALTLAAEHGFAQMAALGTLHQGWALAQQGQREAGMAQIHQGLTALRATGAELGLPYALALLAEAYGAGGQAEEGLHVLTAALTAAHESGQRVYEAELYRLTGELLLQAGTKPEASAAQEYFHQAIAVARQQGAKSFELRAVLSLSRCWQRQGKSAQARQLLAETYAWFTEGFETPDLQEAKALLVELRR